MTREQENDLTRRLGVSLYGNRRPLVYTTPYKFLPDDGIEQQMPPKVDDELGDLEAEYQARR